MRCASVYDFCLCIMRVCVCVCAYACGQQIQQHVQHDNSRAEGAQCDVHAIHEGLLVSATISAEERVPPLP